jgi:CBS domain-containing protein
MPIKEQDETQTIEREKNNQNHRRLITPEMLEDLPEPVRRYMEYTGVVGFPWINNARLKQAGTFRMGPERSWMPVEAEEYYTIDPPSLTWNARFKIAGLPILRAKDRYESGHGHMFGKLAGLFTVFDLTGEELDQATMIRYLNEIMWFPTAYLGENIEWEGLDEHSAQVTFDDGGKSVSARMFFDNAGRLTNFTANRYREIDGDFSLDLWSTPILGYGERAGLKLPVRGQAVWNLPTGDFSYADLEVTEIEYNL